jgi:UDP-GlcNAc:undecaprenyl-phosphate GlcNAc-1-phosphate transferase
LSIALTRLGSEQAELFMELQVTSISFIFEFILLSSLLTALLGWGSIHLSNRMGLVDMPNSAPHKQHGIPTPIAGGIALYGSLLLTAWWTGIYRNPSLVAMYVAALPVFLFGLWDDFREISPLMKLLGQSLAVIILISLGISIKVFESPEFFYSFPGQINVYLDWLLTYLWIVGIINAFNFVDSMDGLALGLAGMATTFFILVTLDAGQPILSRQSVLLLGACIGLYFFNSPPAKLFLGDSGAQTLGFVLAVLAIAYRPLGAFQSSSWVVPIMLLGVPIFDTVLVVLSRIRRGKPIYSASRDHTYHRLVAMGWSSGKAVLIMQVVALLLGCLAFIVLSRPPLVANGIFIAVILVGTVALVYLDNRKLWV